MSFIRKICKTVARQLDKSRQSSADKTTRATRKGASSTKTSRPSTPSSEKLYEYDSSSSSTDDVRYSATNEEIPCEWKTVKLELVRDPSERLDDALRTGCVAPRDIFPDWNAVKASQHAADGLDDDEDEGGTYSGDNSSDTESTCASDSEESAIYSPTYEIKTKATSPALPICPPSPITRCSSTSTLLDETWSDDSDDEPLAKSHPRKSVPRREARKRKRDDDSDAEYDPDSGEDDDYVPHTTSAPPRKRCKSKPTDKADADGASSCSSEEPSRVSLVYLPLVNCPVEGCKQTFTPDSIKAAKVGQHFARCHSDVVDGCWRRCLIPHTNEANIEIKYKGDDAREEAHVILDRPEPSDSPCGEVYKIGSSAETHKSLGRHILAHHMPCIMWWCSCCHSDFSRDDILNRHKGACSGGKGYERRVRVFRRNQNGELEELTTVKE